MQRRTHFPSRGPRRGPAAGQIVMARPNPGPISKFWPFFSKPPKNLISGLGFRTAFQQLTSQVFLRGRAAYRPPVQDHFLSNRPRPGRFFAEKKESSSLTKERWGDPKKCPPAPQPEGASVVCPKAALPPLGRPGRVPWDQAFRGKAGRPIENQTFNLKGRAPQYHPDRRGFFFGFRPTCAGKILRPDHSASKGPPKPLCGPPNGGRPPH